MKNYTEDEIRSIIKRASVLQKFHDHSSTQPFSEDANLDEPIFDIGESLNIKRHFLKEALLEHNGIPVDEPVIVDTNSSFQANIQGYANSTLDGSLVNELRAQIEYHFNTVGKIARRKGNIYWKADPAFPAKAFEITRSPMVELSERNGRVKITVKQSLKTLNKLYVPAVIATFGAVMMTTAVIFGAANGDEVPPMLIVSGMLLVGSFFFSRFIKSRKQKRKEKLVELTETLQQIMERRFRSGKVRKPVKPAISIDEIEVENDDIEIKIPNKANS